MDRFKAASKYFTTKINELADETKLVFYSYYKQATVGDCVVKTITRASGHPSSM
jgi:acyl-CoA-binding protein